MIYSVGDKVIYGIHGICVIYGIETMDFAGQPRKYYLLRPVYEGGTTLFVPCENQALVSKMKRIMQASEIYELIKQIPSEELIWIDSEAERKRKYSEILKNGDRLELLRLIKTLYLHKEKLMECKKKLHASDEGFLRDAEKILHEEFAHVLNITKEQVRPFICEQIEILEK